MHLNENGQPQAVLVCLLNHYLAGMRGGIQVAHAVSRMHLSVSPGSMEQDVIDTWDKVPWMMVFNGGMIPDLENAAQAIEAINESLDASGSPIRIPMARFHEGQDELNGALTAVAFIVPEGWMEQRQGRRFGLAFESLLEGISMGEPRHKVSRRQMSPAYRLNVLFQGLPFQS